MPAPFNQANPVRVLKAALISMGPMRSGWMAILAVLSGWCLWVDGWWGQAGKPTRSVIDGAWADGKSGSPPLQRLKVLWRQVS